MSARARRARRGSPSRPAPSVIVAVLVAGLLVACDNGEAADAEFIEAGEDVYIQNCSRCHQDDGSGWSTLYPALDGNPIVMLDDPNPLLGIVLNGSGGMPGFRESLELNEIAQLVTYVRQAWSNDAGPVLPSGIR